MRQVADSTYVLGTRGHNFYVVRDGDQVTVIDAGCSREWRKPVAGLDSIGLGIDAVAGIVAHSPTAEQADPDRPVGGQPPFVPSRGL